MWLILLLFLFDVSLDCNMLVHAVFVITQCWVERWPTSWSQRTHSVRKTISPPLSRRTVKAFGILIQFVQFVENIDRFVYTKIEFVTTKPVEIQRNANATPTNPQTYLTRTRTHWHANELILVLSFTLCFTFSHQIEGTEIKANGVRIAAASKNGAVGGETEKETQSKWMRAVHLKMLIKTFPIIGLVLYAIENVGSCE